MPHTTRLAIFLIALLFCIDVHAQNFTPITVTGFNQDAIAEGGPSSLATTTKEMDDPVASNKVMYTNAFRVFSGMSGGGLPDNGAIVNGNMTFQLANYAGNNALFVYRGQTQSLSVATPASYVKLRVLGFSTEANVINGSLVNISLSFTDGTTVQYITNYNLVDWFNGTTNQVITGFGRCSRLAAGPYTADGLPSNPRMYYVEITLSCTDSRKLLQQVSFSNVTTAGSNAPFPNQVFMALSGVTFSQTINDVITPCDCSGPNGSIALTVNGSSGPYTYSWNTTPVQNGSTATGLSPGTYTCTITDASGCQTTYTGTVPLNNNAVINATANPTAICPGSSSQLTANTVTGNMTGFTWNPGGLTGNPVTVTPASTTTYTVNATNALGCTATAQVQVTVNPVPASPIVNSVTICSGATATLQVQSPQAGYTYNWYDAATGGTLLGTGTTFTTPTLTSTTTYYVEAVNATNCISAARTTVTVTVTNLPTAPAASGATICSGSTATLSVTSPQAGFTYKWYDAATAGNLLGTGNSFVTPALSSPTTYYVEAVSPGGCISPTRTAVTVGILQQLAAPFVTLTNTTFTSLTFSWTAIPGATGYVVSTDGGATFQSPSSGATGTTHTISGLTGNTTVTIQVKALGPQVCENSAWSLPVSGTTLSSKEIFVPNVFTPNGDGRNDVLLVYGNYVASIQFKVFNQWGELVFQSNNISNGWNGMYKGQQQPVGVYAYTLKVVLQDGTIVNKKGSVNLIR